jgi:hypothetical protein
LLAYVVVPACGLAFFYYKEYYDPYDEGTYQTSPKPDSFSHTAIKTR